MESTYVSKIVSIRRLPEDIFRVLGDFNNLQRVVQGQVENWQSDRDQCSFTVRNVNIGLQIVEREEFKTIKIINSSSTPFDFRLWFQLKQVAPYDTRMRITIKTKLNMMAKMMLHNKLSKGINTLADELARGFNM